MNVAASQERTAAPAHAAAIADCLRSPELFNPWELTFLRNVQHRPRLSRRQAGMVASLVAQRIRRTPAR